MDNFFAGNEEFIFIFHSFVSAKDKEIHDFEEGGATLSRKSLKTKTFSDDLVKSAVVKSGSKSLLRKVFLSCQFLFESTLPFIHSLYFHYSHTLTLTDGIWCSPKLETSNLVITFFDAIAHLL